MVKKKLMVGILAVGMLFSGAMAANAGTTWSGYNTSVAPLNGSGYTGYQTKAVDGATAYLNSGSVGGGYKVDARTLSSGSAGTWRRDVVGGNSYNLNNNHYKGTSLRVQFSNDLATRVSVQVVGSWISN